MMLEITRILHSLVYDISFESTAFNHGRCYPCLASLVKRWISAQAHNSDEYIQIANPALPTVMSSVSFRVLCYQLQGKTVRM